VSRSNNKGALENIFASDVTSVDHANFHPGFPKEDTRPVCMAQPRKTKAVVATVVTATTTTA